MATWSCAECGHPNGDADRRCAICEAAGPDDGAGRPSERQQPVARAPRRPLLPLAVLAVLIVTAAGGAIYLKARADRSPVAAAPTPFVADTTTVVDDDRYAGATPAPAVTEPVRVGLVLVADPAGDWRATAVAAMFDSHFTSVNNRDYATAATFFDPSGVLDPADPAQVAAFAHDMSTTNDSDVTLHAVTSGPGDAVLARVTFRSTQQSGYGPPERPGETCTDWDVTYTLRTTADGVYRIVRGADATSTAC